MEEMLMEEQEMEEMEETEEQEEASTAPRGHRGVPPCRTPRRPQPGLPQSMARSAVQGSVLGLSGVAPCWPREVQGVRWTRARVPQRPPPHLGSPLGCTADGLGPPGALGVDATSRPTSGRGGHSLPGHVPSWPRPGLRAAGSTWPALDSPGSARCRCLPARVPRPGVRGVQRPWGPPGVGAAPGSGLRADLHLQAAKWSQMAPAGRPAARLQGRTRRAGGGRVQDARWPVRGCVLGGPGQRAPLRATGTSGFSWASGDPVHGHPGRWTVQGLRPRRPGPASAVPACEPGQP